MFTIQSVDLYGNEKSTGGDVWTVKLTGPGDVEPSVQDNEDGTYTISYETSVRAIYKLHVTLDEKSITDSPFSIMSDRIFNREWARSKLSAMTSKGGNLKLSDMAAASGQDDDADEEDLLPKAKSEQVQGIQVDMEEDDADQSENMLSEYDPTREVGGVLSEDTNDEAPLEAPPADLQPRKGFSLLAFFKKKK